MRLETKAFLIFAAASTSWDCSTGESREGRRNAEITTLRIREGFVEVRTGPGGRSFSILDLQGRVVAADLSSQELRDQYPSHFEAVEAGLAGEGAGAPLDASGDPPAFGGETTPISRGRAGSINRD